MVLIELARVSNVVLKLAASDLLLNDVGNCISSSILFVVDGVAFEIQILDYMWVLELLGRVDFINEVIECFLVPGGAILTEYF